MKEKIKKTNKKIIVFILVLLFLGAGMLSKDFVFYLAHGVKQVFVDIKSGKPEIVKNFEHQMDLTTSEALSYHDNLIDVNSLKNNLSGTKIVDKEDVKVVKTNSGMLAEEVPRVGEKDIDKAVNSIKELQTIATDNGAHFLYVGVPNKEYFEVMPANVKSFEVDNYDRFFVQLEKSGIENLNLASLYDAEELAGKMYFSTDHHWTPKAGFYATNAICKTLNTKYGFEYREQYCNLNNYNVKTYEKHFLGSYGKKTGRFFTFSSPDDIDLITPKFDTKCVEEQPLKKEKKQGTFEECFLFKKNIEPKALYEKNAYATYSGGDFRQQIMQNELLPKGKKVLLIRTSFGCVVTPFLALQTDELHICDMRDFENFVGNKLNMEEYIRQIKPDYVVVLYNSVSSMADANDRYMFFNK